MSSNPNGVLSIANYNEMVESVDNISTYNQQLANEMESIIYIINQIDTHWISEGEDKRSEIENLRALESKFSNEILPVLKQFVVTMNLYIQESLETSNASK